MFFQITRQICNENAFFQQASLDLMSKGHMLADVVAIIGENMSLVQSFAPTININPDHKLWFYSFDSFNLRSQSFPAVAVVILLTACLALYDFSTVKPHINEQKDPSQPVLVLSERTNLSLGMMDSSNSG